MATNQKPGTRNGTRGKMNRKQKIKTQQINKQKQQQEQRKSEKDNRNKSKHRFSVQMGIDLPFIPLSK